VSHADAWCDDASFKLLFTVQPASPGVHNRLSRGYRPFLFASSRADPDIKLAAMLGSQLGSSLS
jgi:hypothetical protein